MQQEEWFAGTDAMGWKQLRRHESRVAMDPSHLASTNTPRQIAPDRAQLREHSYAPRRLLFELTGPTSRTTRHASDASSRGERRRRSRSDVLWSAATRPHPLPRGKGVRLPDRRALPIAPTAGKPADDPGPKAMRPRGTEAVHGGRVICVTRSRAVRDKAPTEAGALSEPSTPKATPVSSRRGRAAPFHSNPPWQCHG
jgi:hypothetical protein